MIVFIKGTGELIKKVFFDIICLYRNFYRWNISKILISIFSFLIGIVLSLPFFIIALVIAFFSNIEWMQVVKGLLYQNTLMIDIVAANPYLFLGVALLFFLGILAIFFGIFYSVILLYKLNLNFLKDKYHLSFKKDCFNVRKFFNFFKLAGLNILIVLLIFLVFFLVMYIANMFIGGSEIFSILSLIIFIIVLAYVTYRLIFSFIILLNKDQKGAIDCIKKSYKLTRSWKSFFRFIVLFLIFIIISLPIGYTGENLENKYIKINDYTKFLSLTNDEKTMLSENDFYYYNSLKLEYSEYTNEKLANNISFYYRAQWIYFVFSYLILYGVSHMFLVSFYVRELKTHS